MKIGYCISIKEFNTLIKEKEIDLHEVLGFVDLSGQELMRLEPEEFRSLKKELTEREIPCKGVHATFPAEIALTGRSRDKTLLREYCLELSERCDQLGLAFVGIGSPVSRRLTNGYLRQDADQQMVENLQMFSQIFHTKILLESLSQEETNYINSVQSAFWCIKNAGCDRNQSLGLVGDIYHFWKCGEKLEQIPQEVWDQIHYMHIADPVGRAYLSQATSEAFHNYAVTAMRYCSRADEIAVEAVTENICGEIRECNKILTRWMKEA